MFLFLFFVIRAIIPKVLLLKRRARLKRSTRGGLMTDQVLQGLLPMIPQYNEPHETLMLGIDARIISVLVKNAL